MITGRLELVNICDYDMADVFRQCCMMMCSLARLPWAYEDTSQQPSLLQPGANWCYCHKVTADEHRPIGFSGAIVSCYAGCFVAFCDHYAVSSMTANPHGWSSPKTKTIPNYGKANTRRLRLTERIIASAAPQGAIPSSRASSCSQK
jgi:hypothetical protein